MITPTIVPTPGTTTQPVSYPKTNVTIHIQTNAGTYIKSCILTRIINGKESVHGDYSQGVSMQDTFQFGCDNNSVVTIKNITLSNGKTFPDISFSVGTTDFTYNVNLTSYEEYVAPIITSTVRPTIEPTVVPTMVPTTEPTVEPTVIPTVEPTVVPTTSTHSYTAMIQKEFYDEYGVVFVIKNSFNVEQVRYQIPSAKKAGKFFFSENSYALIEYSDMEMGYHITFYIDSTIIPDDGILYVQSGSSVTFVAGTAGGVPTVTPTIKPTMTPTTEPTIVPTVEPIVIPTVEPTIEPTIVPTVEPTIEPTVIPTVEPTVIPTVEPTVVPTVIPTVEPTVVPTIAPSVQPSTSPISLKKSSIKIGKGEKVTVPLKNSAGKKITYHSANKKIATVTSKGVVKGVKAGTTTIRIKANGKTCNLKVKVKKKPTKVRISSVPNVKMGIGDKLFLQAILSSGSASYSIKWSSSNKKVVTVNSKGVATIKGRGKATIKVKTYNGKTAKLNLNIK